MTRAMPHLPSEVLAHLSEGELQLLNMKTLDLKVHSVSVDTSGVSQDNPGTSAVASLPSSSKAEHGKHQTPEPHEWH